MLIDDALASFVLQLQADGRSPHTVSQYRRHVRLLARWTDDVGHSGEVEDIDHQLIARFMTAPCARVRADGRKKRATSVNALRTSLRCFFGYLHDVDLVLRLVGTGGVGPDFTNSAYVHRSHGDNLAGAHAGVPLEKNHGRNLG